MRIVSYENLENNVGGIMDMTQDNYEPTIITREQGDMVLMSLKEYNSLKETLFILNNPKNALRILESVKELREGKGEIHELVEVQI